MLIDIKSGGFSSAHHFSQKKPKVNAYANPLHHYLFSTHIFPYLVARDILSASRVCRTWYNASQDDLLWKKLCASKYGISQLPEGIAFWKTAYKLYHSYSEDRIKLSTLCENTSGFYLHENKVCTAHKSSSGFFNLRIWDLKTERLTHAINHTSCPTAIAIQGIYLFVIDCNARVERINLENGSIDFSFENCRLLLIERDYLILGRLNDVLVYDANSCTCIYKISLNEELIDMQVCKKVLVCAFWGGRIDLLNLEDGRRILQLTCTPNIEKFHITQNGILITGHMDGSIRLYDTRSWKQTGTLESGFSGVNALQSFGTILLSHHEDHLCIWDMHAKKQLRSHKLGPNLQFNDSHIVNRIQETVNTIHFSTN